MKRWILGIAAGLLVLSFLLVVVAGAAYYFLYYKPRQAAGPLTAEALHMPADVGVVGGVDLQKIFATPLFVLAKGQIADSLKEARDKTGLDVEKDLKSVAFGSWTGTGGNQGLALLSGTFDRSRLRLALEKEGKSSRDVGGIGVYAVDQETSLALVSDTLVVLGTTGRLTTYLENRKAGERPLAKNLELMKSIQTIPKETALWIQVAEPTLAELQKATADGAPPGLKPPALKALAVTADVSPGLVLVIAARPREEKDAEEFGKQLEAALTMAGAFVGDKPEIKQILNAIKVTRGAGEVKLTLSAPWDVFAKAFVTPMLAARTSANESATIGNIRTMISAQAAYQSVTAGYYGSVECLKTPSKCDPTYSGPSFLDESFPASGEKNGYRYEFVLSPGKDMYAVSAVPVTIGQTGKRAFCGDHSGLICQFADGKVPSLSSGQCPPGCEPIG